MPHSSKRKGNRAEREVVHLADEHKMIAERAYASNGQALGLTEDVDVAIQTSKRTIAVQVKRRARVADYLKPPPGCAIVAWRADQEPWYATIPLADLLELYRKADGDTP